MTFEYHFTSVGFPLITHNQEKNIKKIQTEVQSTKIQSLNPQNCLDHQKQKRLKSATGQCGFHGCGKRPTVASDAGGTIVGDGVSLSYFTTTADSPHI